MPHCFRYSINGEDQSITEIDNLVTVQVFKEEPDPKYFHWAFDLLNYAVATGKKLKWIVSTEEEKFHPEVIAVAKWLIQNGYKEDAWREIGKS